MLEGVEKEAITRRKKSELLKKNELKGDSDLQEQSKVKKRE